MNPNPRRATSRDGATHESESPPAPVSQDTHDFVAFVNKRGLKILREGVCLLADDGELPNVSVYETETLNTLRYLRVLEAELRSASEKTSSRRNTFRMTLKRLLCLRAVV